MRRIRSHLTLHTAVPIDVTSTASLGRDADLVGAGRVGAGLGRPVAAGALERNSNFWGIFGGYGKHHTLQHFTQSSFRNARWTEMRIAGRAGDQCTGALCAK